MSSQTSTASPVSPPDSKFISPEDRIKMFNLLDSSRGKVYCYIRVSTQQQALEGHSLETQKSTLTRLCFDHNLSVDLYFEDVAVSGKSTVGRHEFNKMMSLVKPNDTIVAQDLSRLTRSSKDLNNLIFDLEKRKINLLLFKEKWHLKFSEGDIDPITRLLLSVFSFINQMESQLASERTKHVINNLKREGKLNLKPRVGYQYVLDESGNRMLVPNDKEQALINFIFNQLIMDPKVTIAHVTRLVNHEMEAGNISYRNLKSIAPTQVSRIVKDNNLREYVNEHKDSLLKNKKPSSTPAPKRLVSNKNKLTPEEIANISLKDTSDSKDPKLKPTGSLSQVHHAPQPIAFIYNPPPSSVLNSIPEPSNSDEEDYSQPSDDDDE